jgi:hypothetical protein
MFVVSLGIDGFEISVCSSFASAWLVAQKYMSKGCLVEVTQL